MANIDFKKIRDDIEKLGIFIIEDKKELLDRAIKFNTILDGLPHPMYVVDVETHKIIFVNKALKKIFGNDLKGKICYKVFQNLDKPCPFCNNDKLEFNKTIEWIFRNNVNGRWYRVYDTGIKWVNGKMVRLEFAIDINEEIKNQKLMRMFKHFLDVIPHGIMMISQSRNDVVYLNNKAREYLNINKSYLNSYSLLVADDEIDGITKLLIQIKNKQKLPEYVIMRSKKYKVISGELIRDNGDSFYSITFSKD